MLYINALRRILAKPFSCFQRPICALIWLVSVFVLGGCMFVNIAETRNLETPSEPFQRALYQQYAELALREVEEGNIASAQMFDRNARLAAAGDDVPLPNTQDTHVLNDALTDLHAGKKTLQKFFDHEVYHRMPIVSARAQAMLDCWIEEQLQGVDEGDIVACRQAFERAIAALRAEFPALSQSIK